MSASLQVTWRHLPASPAVTRCLRARFAKLASHFPMLLAAHVVVGAPHQHRRHGRPFHLTLELIVPGAEITVGHEPASSTGRKPGADRSGPHEDAYLAVHDAFDQAHRRLEDRVRRMRPSRRRAKVRDLTAP